MCFVNYSQWSVPNPTDISFGQRKQLQIADVKTARNGTPHKKGGGWVGADKCYTFPNPIYSSIPYT